VPIDFVDLKYIWKNTKTASYYVAFNSYEYLTNIYLPFWIIVSKYGMFIMSIDCVDLNKLGMDTNIVSISCFVK
jgi:hypothetical protein